MDNLKVCMITTRHLPGDPRIFEKEARSLKKMGYDVDIVVPQGPMPEEDHGVFFRFFQKAPGPFRKISTIIHTYRQSKASQAEVYHCHEIDVSLFIGYLLKRWGRRSSPVKLVFDCHEFFLGYFASRMPALIRPFFRFIFVRYEKWMLKHCDHIITANSIERSYYQIMFPLKATTIIYNVPHLEAAAKARSSSTEKEYDLCFEGFMNLERGQKILFELVKRLKAERDDFKLLILGEIQKGPSKEWAEKFIRENRLEQNITVSGWQPYSRLYEFHVKSKIGIYLYQYTPNNLLAGPPNKLFNFMKAGLPIIASNLPETVNILNEIKCGIAVNPGDLDRIESAVRKLLNDDHLRAEMGQNGRAAFQSRYNWDVEEAKLKEIYHGLLNADAKVENSGLQHSTPA